MGRKKKDGKKKPLVGDEEIDAASIPTFCRRIGISVSQFYLLRAQGFTPRETKIGARSLITSADRADWLRRVASGELVIPVPDRPDRKKSGATNIADTNICT